MWAGREALAYGRGGIAAVSRATGLARATVSKGMRAVEAGETIEPGHVRRVGGGRRPLEDHDAALLVDLEHLVAEEAHRRLRRARMDHPGSVRGARKEHCTTRGHQIHYTSVARYLRRLGFSMPSNRTPAAGARAPKTAAPSSGSSIAM